MEFDNFQDNEQGFIILKHLIDTRRNQHIPYQSYNNTFMNRIHLDDRNRLDVINLNNINVNQLAGAMATAMRWLYSELWKKFAVHGDLTTNNIIYQNNTVFFIDWVDTSNIYKPGICTFWYILADVIDFVNSFRTRIPQIFTVNSQTFDIWYNVIKMQEDYMKDNGDNAAQCQQAIMSNMTVLKQFFDFLSNYYNINMRDIFQANMVSGGKKRKQKKTKRYKKKGTTKRRRRYLNSFNKIK